MPVGIICPRQELAELVNRWVFEHTNDHRLVELDANYIGKLEQGRIRWPQNPLPQPAQVPSVVSRTTSPGYAPVSRRSGDGTSVTAVG
ncbi:MAG: hypothetical protein ACRDTG_17535 [Pseudonocardiaceae bacterium]